MRTHTQTLHEIYSMNGKMRGVHGPGVVPVSGVRGPCQGPSVELLTYNYFLSTDKAIPDMFTQLKM